MYLFGLNYRPQGQRTPGTYNLAPTMKDWRVSEVMSRYWVNFARTGDPNGEGLPRWSKHAPSHPATLVIDDTTRPVPDFRADRLKLWFDKWEAETGLEVQ
jgi:para-nitrobenzyl esterase